MSILGFYLIFCLATAFSMLYEVVLPTLSKLRKEQPDNILFNNYKLTLCVLFGMSVLAAPLLLPVCLIPKYSNAARDAMFEVWKD